MDDMTQPEHRLRQYQLQLDPDGIEVGVSRQALEETLEKLETFRQENERLGSLAEEWQGKARAFEVENDRLQVQVLLLKENLSLAVIHIQQEDNYQTINQRVPDEIKRARLNKFKNALTGYVTVEDERDKQVLALREALEACDKVYKFSTSLAPYNPERFKDLKDLAIEAMTKALQSTQPTYDAILERVRAEAAVNALETAKKVFSKSANREFTKEHVLKELHLVILAQQEGEPTR